MPSAVDTMRTSELLRLAASELAALATVEKQRASDHRELAAELRIRARWIESARRDAGVSRDRAMGIEAIEEPIADSEAKGVA